MENNIIELTLDKINRLVESGYKISEGGEMTNYSIDKIRVVECLRVDNTLDCDLYINGIMVSSTTNGDNTSKVFVILRDLYYTQLENKEEFIINYLKS